MAQIRLRADSYRVAILQFGGHLGPDRYQGVSELFNHAQGTYCRRSAAE